MDTNDRRFSRRTSQDPCEWCDPTELNEVASVESSDEYLLDPLAPSHQWVIAPQGQSDQSVIDLLREIRDLQIRHEGVAATKEQVSLGTQTVLATLRQQNTELREGIAAVERHLDLFSVRTIFSVLSLISVAFSTLLLIVTLVWGPIEIDAPLPHLLVVFSMGVYLMARKLPRHTS